MSRYLLCNKASVANLTRQPSIIQTNLPGKATPPLEDHANSEMINVVNEVNKLDIQDNVFSEVKDVIETQKIESPSDLHEQPENLAPPLEEQQHQNIKQKPDETETPAQDQEDEVIDEVTISATQVGLLFYIIYLLHLLIELIKRYQYDVIDYNRVLLYYLVNITPKSSNN